MRKMILFVDFYGTICFDRFWHSLSGDQSKKIQELYVKYQHVADDWMRGKYTSEEINAILADRLDINAAELWDLFVEDCKTVRVSQTVLKRLSALRTKYIVILMTDNMDSFSRFTVPSLKLDQYVDVISNSFYVGRLKNDDDGALFAEYTQQFTTTPEETILIDDRKDICSIFTHLGGKAYRVTKDRTIGDVLSELER